MAAGMLITTGTLYVLFSNSDLQSWNTPEENDAQSALESELKVLKKGEEEAEEEDTSNNKTNIMEKCVK